ncbi:MAG: sterol desaturase family protein [Pseudohaliea sp.]
MNGSTVSSGALPDTPPVLSALALAVWALVGAVSVFLATQSVEDLPLLSRLLAPLREHVGADKAMFSPLAYFILFSMVWVLEAKLPAERRRQPVANFVQDFSWYLVTMAFRITLLAAYTSLLFAAYQQYLSWMTIDAAASWHPLTRFVVAVLVADFFRWFAHYLMHKVPLFWEFHALHHSQTELNIFTDARVHPFERIIAGSIKFLPAMMLANALPVLVAWAVFETIYPKFYHANVRINLGPLRYLLVTPQSHRVHHGRDEPYRDKNFGFTFSIWDWLFGTQYRDHTVYPETGIPDSEFPAAPGRGPFSLASNLVRQFIYPIKRALSLAAR